jgi:hypothetical protein
MTFKRPILRAKRAPCMRPVPILQKKDTGVAARVYFSALDPPVSHVHVWAPPSDHEGYARLLERRGESVDEFWAKTDAYYAAHPTPEPMPAPAPKPAIDTELVASSVKLYSTPKKWYKLLRVAGYSEAAIQKAIDRRQWLKDHDAELEEEINRRWGSAPTKATKKKIKAVKKKMV